MTKLFDLTYELTEDMLKYPSDSEPNIVTIPSSIELVNEETRYKSGRQILNMTNHHGTHIDAPCHKVPGGKKITNYPLDKFVNQCMVIDLTDTNVLKRREVSLDDIRSSNFRLLADLGGLIIYTGFCDLMAQIQGDLKGHEKTGFEATFPYLSQEAARYIAGVFPKLNVIGIDSFAVDRQGSNSEVHRTFFAKDILPLETVVGLHQLKPHKYEPFTLHSVPLKITGDAAQVRAYAEIE